MKKFVELVQRAYQENFQTVMNKIVAEKIPVSFLSLAPVENSVEIVKQLRSQNLNIVDLVTISPPPRV